MLTVRAINCWSSLSWIPQDCLPLNSQRKDSLKASLPFSHCHGTGSKRLKKVEIFLLLHLGFETPHGQHSLLQAWLPLTPGNAFRHKPTLLFTRDFGTAASLEPGRKTSWSPCDLTQKDFPGPKPTRIPGYKMPLLHFRIGYDTSGL